MKIFITLFLLSLSAYGSETPKLYHEENKDKLAPITYYFNASFDVIQNPYYFSQKQYTRKHNKLFKRISSPNHSIKKDGGYKKFFEDEFTTTRVIPNVGLHVIGGAYDNLYYYQFFKENDYPLPLLFTIALTYLGHFGNEALELTNPNITSHDHIADLFIFDVASYFLAFNPDAMDLLVNDMEMQSWHLQPMYLPKEDEFTNTGLNYIFRPFYKKSKLRPFVFMGMQNLLGLSYLINKKNTVTVASGMALTDPLEQKGKFTTAVFLEKNKELVASVYLNGTEDYRYRINIYPKMFKAINNYSLLFGQKRNKDLILGLNFNLPFGAAANLN